MKDSNKPDRPGYVDVTIEGSEDLSVHPWQGPSPVKPNPIGETSARFSRENFHALIVNDEDLTVRPWRQAPATPIGSGVAPGPTEPRVERPVSGQVRASQHIRFEKIEDVTVLSFAGTEILAEESIEEISKTVAQIEIKEHIRLLVNFSDVLYLSSAVLGELIKLKKKVSGVKGVLRLCCIHPELMEVFRIARLDQVFQIYEDEQSALLDQF